MSAQSITLYGGIMGKALGFATVQSSALMGLTPHRIAVEVGCTKGPPLFQMVGLPEAPVREARVRVASALCQLGVLIDAYAITVNLAPADLPKSGATLDLSLALGVLAAIERFPASCLEGVLVLGELSLEGSLRPLRGVLPQLHGMLGGALHTAIVPACNGAEAGLVVSGNVLLAESLRAVLEHFTTGPALPGPARSPFCPPRDSRTEVDLKQVRGQRDARRSLEVAAAGNHNRLRLWSQTYPVVPAIKAGDARLGPPLLDPGDAIVEPWRPPGRMTGGPLEFSAPLRRHGLRCLPRSGARSSKQVPAFTIASAAILRIPSPRPPSARFSLQLGGAHALEAHGQERQRSNVSRLSYRQGGDEAGSMRIADVD